MSFLLTLTKKAKNRRIKRNFIKNIFRAALSRAGYCLGHGLGLHLLPRQFHLPSFPGNIGHKSSLPVFPVNSSQQNRPAPEAVFPPESSPVFSASTAPHFQCHSRNPENTNPRRNAEGYSDPTAYEAPKNIEREEDERFHKLLHTLFYLCELADFEIEGRIILVDRRNGRVWR